MVASFEKFVWTTDNLGALPLGWRAIDEIASMDAIREVGAGGIIWAALPALLGACLESLLEQAVEGTWSDEARAIRKHWRGRGLKLWRDYVQPRWTLITARGWMPLLPPQGSRTRQFM